jgi:predicted nucleotidyltransferase
MRLTAFQIDTIKRETEKYFGATAQVWLFGSRVDDHQRGGDVDLYVRPAITDPAQLATARFAFLAQLKRRIGDRKIDLVLQRAEAEELPIHRLARQQGVQL